MSQSLLIACWSPDFHHTACIRAEVHTISKTDSIPSCHSRTTGTKDANRKKTPMKHYCAISLHILDPTFPERREHIELIGKEAASCQPQLFQRGPWTIEDSLKHNKLKTQQKHHVQTNIYKSSSPELDDPLRRSENIPIQMHSCTHLTTALLRLNPPESDTSISDSTYFPSTNLPPNLNHR
jgi:hypothetical protein